MYIPVNTQHTIGYDLQGKCHSMRSYSEMGLSKYKKKLPLMEILLARISDSEDKFRSSPMRISRTKKLSFLFETSRQRDISHSSTEKEQNCKEEIFHEHFSCIKERYRTREHFCTQ